MTTKEATSEESMIEKIKALFKEDGNLIAAGLIALGAAVVLLKHEEAGKCIIAGGLTHLKT